MECIDGTAGGGAATGGTLGWADDVDVAGVNNGGANELCGLCILVGMVAATAAGLVVVLFLLNFNNYQQFHKHFIKVSKPSRTHTQVVPI